jgi:uncharacterized membrane protein YsdA (DUF1294 family)
MFAEPSLIIVVFAVLNLLAFLLMLWDKNISQGKNERNRISEGMLFFMATLFGSVGVYLGMFVLRHKTRKWYFVVGIPLLILQNISFLYLVHEFFVSLKI